MTAESFATSDTAGSPASIDARSISHAFEHPALSSVDLRVRAGDVHALLGPNGAGKTTLLRVLAGLLRPDEGSLAVSGCDGIANAYALRERVGLMPSGDGTLYPRISGLENLVFFGRLHGLRRRDALLRARELLELVGLTEHADKPVRAYSHGMQKRLSFARALLAEPPVLLVDEATHDLDPHAARVVRDLTCAAAARGAAVVWATQRLDEIRGFADDVTLLKQGTVCFAGTVAALLSRALPTRYLVRLRNGGTPATELVRLLGDAMEGNGRIEPAPRAADDDFVLVLRDGYPIGDVVTAFAARGVQVLACREERSGVEEAFVALTGGEGA
jgi:ABC-2 type transport system ATP-binding protein